MRFHGEVDFWEVYDLDTDLYELVNRFADSEYTATREQLQKRLTELAQELGDEVSDG
jgi:hypothetical protein